MIPYIVKGTVFKTPYMSDDVTFEDIRIVMASDPDEALEKFEKYWDDKTDEYSVYYRADGYVMETIL